MGGAGILLDPMGYLAERECTAVYVARSVKIDESSTPEALFQIPLLVWTRM